MKTTHFFTSLLILITVIGCSTEEIALENETTELNSEDSNALNLLFIIDNADDDDDDDDIITIDFNDLKPIEPVNICNYFGPAVYVYYKRSPSIFLSNTKYAQRIKTQALANSDINPTQDKDSGCKLYKVTNAYDFKYDTNRGQLYEIWHELGNSGRPINRSYELELP